MSGKEFISVKKNVTTVKGNSYIRDLKTTPQLLTHGTGERCGKRAQSPIEKTISASKRHKHPDDLASSSTIVGDILPGDSKTTRGWRLENQGNMCKQKLNPGQVLIQGCHISLQHHNGDLPLVIVPLVNLDRLKQYLCPSNDKDGIQASYANPYRCKKKNHSTEEMTPLAVGGISEDDQHIRSDDDRGSLADFIVGDDADEEELNEDNTKDVAENGESNHQ
ncbi:hypothetical protein K439DRAFT_1625586 [Ramaria rubella]|nr:hypothetical protein K439DRAFT_1625586 [Ramaria rubella]